MSYNDAASPAQMLSAISSTHLDSNPTYSPAKFPHFTDFAIRSQISAQQPLPNHAQGPTLKQISLNPVTYQTAFPVQIVNGQENSIMITVLAKRNNYVAKATSSGAVDAFCKPLLEQLDAECLGCKIYARGVYTGLGEVSVRICEGLEEVCYIMLQFYIIAEPTSNPFYIYPQNQSVYGNSKLYDTMALQQHYNYTQHSQTPATYYNQSYISGLPVHQSGIVETPIYNAQFRPQTVGFNAPTVDLYKYAEPEPQQSMRALFRPYNSQSYVTKSQIAQTRTHDQQIHIPNERTQQKHEKLSKIIRVLPSDAILGPADSLHPALRPIRVRNVNSEELSIKCQIVGRRYPDGDEMEKVVDCTGASFKILANYSFVLAGCSNPETEIISGDVLLQFQPETCDNQKWLHSAKLVIKVAGKTTQKAFQVPLLGVSGQPEIVPSLAGKGCLRVQNTGNCPVFCRLKAAITRGNSGKNALAAPFALDFESLILKPGESQNVRITKIEDYYNQSSDEKQCIQIRYGHEALRLLALASDGKGPWKGVYEALKVKDDVLRVMGGCIELVSVDLD